MTEVLMESLNIIMVMGRMNHKKNIQNKMVNKKIKMEIYRMKMRLKMKNKNKMAMFKKNSKYNLTKYKKKFYQQKSFYIKI